MSDIERVNEIERLIAEGRLNAAQVFTQMKQLLPAAQAPASGEVEPVGYLTVEHFRDDPNMQNVDYEHIGAVMKPGRHRVFNHPPAKVPEGWVFTRIHDRARGTIRINTPYGDAFPVSLSNSADIFEVALYRMAETLLTTPTPATTPETEWVKCPSCGDFAYECDVCGGKPTPPQEQ